MFLKLFFLGNNENWVASRFLSSKRTLEQVFCPLGGVEVGGHLIIKLKYKKITKNTLKKFLFVLLEWGELGGHLVVSFGRGRTWWPFDCKIINKNCEEKKLVSFRRGRTKWPLDFHPKEIIKSYNNSSIIMIKLIILLFNNLDLIILKNFIIFKYKYK